MPASESTKKLEKKNPPLHTFRLQLRRINSNSRLKKKGKKKIVECCCNASRPICWDSAGEIEKPWFSLRRHISANYSLGSVQTLSPPPIPLFYTRKMLISIHMTPPALLATLRQFTPAAPLSLHLIKYFAAATLSL
jgi:hypothetical protein